MRATTLRQCNDVSREVGASEKQRSICCRLILGLHVLIPLKLSPTQGSSSTTIPSKPCEVSRRSVSNDELFVLDSSTAFSPFFSQARLLGTLAATALKLGMWDGIKVGAGGDGGRCVGERMGARLIVVASWLADPCRAIRSLRRWGLCCHGLSHP